MDLRFIKSLIHVVDTGSIAAAARAQGLTSTAVSQRIRALENELSTELLSRSAHAAKPTEACMSILPRARELITSGDALKSDLDIDGLSGTIKLGVIATALTDRVPAIVSAFAEHAPNADLIIQPGASAMLYEQLISANQDAAILVSPHFTPDKGLKVTKISKQKLVLISPHQLNMPVDQVLQSYPLIGYDKTSWGGQVIWQWIKDMKLNLQLRCEVDSLETIAILVEQGLGVAIVPQWNGLKQRHPSLCITPLDAITEDIIANKDRNFNHTPSREIVFICRKMAIPQRLITLAFDAAGLVNGPKPVKTTPS